MKLGFTGTRNGMTDPQLLAVCHFLAYNADVIDEAHFGLARGADAQFYYLCQATNIAWIVGHPCDLTDQQIIVKCDDIWPVKDPITRNHDIVDCVDVMVGTPATNYNVLRSGTYSTLRYAAKEERTLKIAHTMTGIFYDEINYEQK